MSMAQWTFRWIACLAGAATVAFSQAQTTTELYDIEQFGQPNDYIDRVQLLEMIPDETAPSARLRFSGAFSSIGQRFTTPRNWGALKGLSCKITNNSNVIVSLGYSIEVNAQYQNGVRSGFELRPGESKPVHLDLTGQGPGLYGLANPIPALANSYRHVYPWASPALGSVYRWTLFMRTNITADLTVTGLTGYTTVPSPTGVFDRFGQYRHGTWAGKVGSALDMARQGDDEDADLAANPGPGELTGTNRWSATSKRGKWRVHRTSGGTAYFLSPEGKYFWSLGMVSPNQSSDTIVEGRESLFQDLPGTGDVRSAHYGTISVAGVPKRTYAHYSANLREKYGENYSSEWSATTSKRLRSWGFNTLGVGFDFSLLGAGPIPFVHFGTTDSLTIRVQKPLIGGSLADPFSSTFQSNVTNVLATNIAPFASNDRLMGLYVDGELGWGHRYGDNRSKYALSLGSLASGPSQPAKVAFVNQLTSKYVSIANLNTAWGTSFASWTGLRSASVTLNDSQLALARADLSTFLYTYAKTYFAKARNAVRTVLPNGLYLGGREDLQFCPDEILNAAQAYCDVISLDIYEDPTMMPWTLMSNLQKPVLISEFSFLAREGGAFPAVNNPYIECDTQAQRAQVTNQVLTLAARNKNIIGVHWWRYLDEPTSGKSSNKSNWHLGVVSSTDRPYQEMVSTFRSFSSSMYQTRGL